MVKGGNYGWAYREGLHAGPKAAPAGFTSINPIHEYGHGSGPARGNSVTGGVVYRGQRLSQLYGAYVFADYTSGNVWTLRADGTNLVPSQRITGAAGPVAFGIDPRNGDVLIVQLGGQIMRLNYDSTPVGTPLPPTLADTGAFSDLASLTPSGRDCALRLKRAFLVGRRPQAKVVLRSRLECDDRLQSRGELGTAHWRRLG